MKTHWIDLVIAALMLLSLWSGYRKGLLASIFSVLGYVVGGLLALYFATNFVQDWDNSIKKFGLLALAIIIGAGVGSAILGRLGTFIHNRALIGPLALIDSLLGAALSVARTLIFIYLFGQLALITPWSWPHQYIPKSTIYKEINQRAPHIIKSVMEKTSNLHSSPTADLLG